LEKIPHFFKVAQAVVKPKIQNVYIKAQFESQKDCHKKNI